MDECLDLFQLASLAHFHGRVNLVVSCVLFVERGDQEVVEDRCDSGQGKVRGCVLRFGGAQSLERGFRGIVLSVYLTVLRRSRSLVERREENG